MSYTYTSRESFLLLFKRFSYTSFVQQIPISIRFLSGAKQLEICVERSRLASLRLPWAVISRPLKSTHIPFWQRTPHRRSYSYE